MKTIFKTLLILVALLMQIQFVFASTTKSITITAKVPHQEELKVVSLSGYTLDFGTLQYNTENNIYTTSKYFVVEIDNFSSVQITYNDVSSPTGALKGLGKASFITLVKAVYTGATTPPNETILSKHALHNLNTSINYSVLNKGWLKMYLGLSTGDPDQGEPQGVTPFTAKDKPGDYIGTMTITATTR